jgi:hypothetical protein
MLKRILLFDVNRILFFDINRILRWEISRAVIPTVVLKAVLGVIAGGFLVAIVVPLAAQYRWPIHDWVPPGVMLLSVLGAIATDLRHIVRTRRRRA